MPKLEFQKFTFSTHVNGKKYIPHSRSKHRTPRLPIEPPRLPRGEWEKGEGVGDMVKGERELELEGGMVEEEKRKWRVRWERKEVE